MVETTEPQKPATRADEGRGDHHRPRADHADRDRNQELALVEPADYRNLSA